MNDWNTVITVHERHLPEVLELLGRYGTISRTEYFNVAVMKADEPRFLLETLREEALADLRLSAVLARLVPADRTFNFQSAEDFELKAKAVVGEWVTELGGKRFHVRMRRRGFKGRISSMEEERRLDGFLLEALERMGRPGRIDFDDPDRIVSVETVGQRAGLSLWTREELERYPLLRFG